MDLRIRFRYLVNLAMFLYFTCCHSVSSDPVKRNMLEAIIACDSVKFLYNSTYINKCSTLSYPVKSVNYDTDKDGELYVKCMTLNRITTKICEFHISEKSEIELPDTAEKFDEEVKQLEPKPEDRGKFVADWCQNKPLIFNISIQNDTDRSYVKRANELLLDNNECILTCQIRHGVNPFCMVFFWFNRFYNTLTSSKHFDTPKEAVVPGQESLHKSTVDDNGGKQSALKDDKNEHLSSADQKPAKEQSKSKFPDTNAELSNKLKTDSVRTGGEPEVKKNMQQSNADDREQQKQDSNLPSSTDNKLNLRDENNDENKLENSKTEFQDGNDDFTDDERKKAMGEGADGDSDHDITETDKRGPFSDPGDQHSFLDSPVIKEEDESHFFMYFSILSFACVMLYIGYHNKQKILAIVLEGRQSRRGRGSRRRPNTANYRKLDSNLEEAVTSQCNSNVTHVIY